MRRRSSGRSASPAPLRRLTCHLSRHRRRPPQPTTRTTTGSVTITEGPGRRLAGSRPVSGSEAAVRARAARAASTPINARPRAKTATSCPASGSFRDSSRRTLPSRALARRPRAFLGISSSQKARTGPSWACRAQHRAVRSSLQRRRRLFSRWPSRMRAHTALPCQQACQSTSARLSTRPAVLEGVPPRRPSPPAHRLLPAGRARSSVRWRRSARASASSR